MSISASKFCLLGGFGFGHLGCPPPGFFRSSTAPTSRTATSARSGTGSPVGRLFLLLGVLDGCGLGQQQNSRLAQIAPRRCPARCPTYRDAPPWTSLYPRSKKFRHVLFHHSRMQVGHEERTHEKTFAHLLRPILIISTRGVSNLSMVLWCVQYVFLVGGHSTTSRRWGARVCCCIIVLRWSRRFEVTMVKGRLPRRVRNYERLIINNPASHTHTHTQELQLNQSTCNSEFRTLCVRCV